MKIIKVACFLSGVFILFTLVNFSSALEFNSPVVLNILSNNAFWEVKAVADFNNDSVQDLLFQHHVTGKLSILFMNPDGTKNDSVIISDVNLVWKIKAVDDLDKDGVADIIWQHSVTGKVALWLMNSNGTSKAKSSLMDNTVWQLKTLVDFNNDSVQDLLFQHPVSGKMIVWFMNIDGSKNSTLIIPSPNFVWKMKAIVDFNNDSIPDLIFQHAIDGRVIVWLMSYDSTLPQSDMIICTSFNYSDWSGCLNGTQLRKITSSVPENCVDGDFEIIKDCVVFVEQVLNITNASEKVIVVIDNKKNISEPVAVLNETNNSTTFNEQINETNITTVQNVSLTCAQIGLSLNFLPENILCICPSCEVQPPTICARMGFFDLQNSSDCTYCCGKTS
jgi:hypothetical protein